jgi:hypothetical protein
MVDEPRWLVECEWVCADAACQVEVLGQVEHFRILFFFLCVRCEKRTRIPNRLTVTEHPIPNDEDWYTPRNYRRTTFPCLSSSQPDEKNDR